jgi:hypothetical protein
MEITEKAVSADALNPFGTGTATKAGRPQHSGWTFLTSLAPALFVRVGLGTRAASGLFRHESRPLLRSHLGDLNPGPTVYENAVGRSAAALALYLMSGAIEVPQSVHARLVSTRKCESHVCRSAWNMSSVYSLPRVIPRADAA